MTFDRNRMQSKQAAGSGLSPRTFGRGWTILRNIFRDHRIQKSRNVLTNCRQSSNLTNLTQEDVTSGNHFLRYTSASSKKALDVWGVASELMRPKEDFPERKSRPAFDILCQFEPSLRDLRRGWDDIVHSDEGVAEFMADPIINKVASLLVDEMIARCIEEATPLERKVPVMLDRLWRDPDDKMMGLRCPQTVCRLGRPLLDTWTIMSPYPSNRRAMTKMEASRRRQEAIRPRSRPQSTPAYATRERPKSNFKKLQVDENGRTVFEYSLAWHQSLIATYGPTSIKPLVLCRA